MNQLTLDFITLPPYRFDYFVTGKNQAVLTALMHRPLNQTDQLSLLDEHDRFIYLWGEAYVGKSHLLQAWLHYQRTHAPHAVCVYWDATRYYQKEQLELALAADFVAIDHIDNLTEEAQIAVFALYNHFKNQGIGELLMAGRLPPAQQTHLRDDLRTRMSWGLVWPVLGLSDEDKQTALQIQARARGLTISPEVFEYIIKNSDRDLHHLSAMLALLDEYSLEQKRALTLPFVKSILKDLS